MRIVLDADKATVADDPLFRIATHVVFSSECLVATTGRSDLAEGLEAHRARIPMRSSRSAMGRATFFSSTTRSVRRVPVFPIRAVDTLGAGDALHGGFALALAEGRSEAEALRFGAAVAGDQVRTHRRFRRCAERGRKSRLCWRKAHRCSPG